ncbi:EthD family reductase [Pseudorhodoplanes sp.]|uniref:EthD family reductase n=1 Tax=Pseudorhodoplanes sp. TaxID=1934341 RepID=UPI003D0B4B2B
MVSYFVRYDGIATEPAAFVDYYARGHAAILERFTGIRSLMLHTPQVWNDPFPVNPGRSLLLAQMTFEDAAALDAALRSEARKEAREDFARFPAFKGEVTHQAMKTEVIF